MTIPLFGLYDYIIFSVFTLYALVDHIHKHPFNRETILKNFDYTRMLK